MDDSKAEDSNDNAPLPSGGQRKRPAPTIDLPPSEVTDTTPKAEHAQADAVPETPRSGWRARFGGAEPQSTTEDSVHDTPPAHEEIPSSAKTILISALSGAAAALIVGGAWVALTPTSSDRDAPSPQTVVLDALNTRVTKLETKPSIPPAPLDDGALVKRLNALENEVASIRKDVAGLRAQSETTTANIASLKSISGNNPPAQDLSGIEDRLSKLEQTIAAPAEPPHAANLPDDTSLRRAVAATSLDQSVNQGAPFAAALTAAVKLNEDGATLKPLEAFAATGVPTASALARELLALLRPLEAERTSLPASAGWIDRLRASALSLVRVTRVDEQGSDRAALLVRAKAAAQREDIAEANNLIMQLPDADRAKLQVWIGKVDARDAALAAVRQFAQDAAAALPKSSTSIPQ